MMAIQEIRIPDIGTANAVEVIEILVKTGDRVECDAPLITLESDKATMEVPSPAGGIVTELRIVEGDSVTEGHLIALLDVAEESGVDKEEAKPTDEQPVVPEAPAPTPAPAAPVPEVSQRREPTKPASPPPVATNSAGKIPPYASPSIRQLARELAVPLASVKGSGDKGRITKADVFAYVKQALQGNSSPSAGAGGIAVAAMPKVDFSQFGEISRQSLTRIQKISGANLHRNWVSIPHVTNHDDADITELEAFRRQINAEQDRLKSAVKVTMVALVIKAVVAALQRFPRFNASLDGDDLVLKHYFHIGFAADTSTGLVVPVLRDADKKGLLQIAEEVSALSAKARAGKLSASDMSGGCFSISSLGGIGGSYFTPIINAPEVAILGLGKATERVVWNQGSPAPRLEMPISLSWDHRAVDGAMAGRFNAYLCELLADFRRVLM